jgi:hypothetical protein
MSAAIYSLFAALWLAAFFGSKPPEFPIMYFWSAFALAVAATPWVIAARMLFRDWLKRASTAYVAVDVPSHLLAMATAALPADRRDWGLAMSAEMSHVQGYAARWRFALDCARVALFPPRRSSTPLALVILALIVVVATTYVLIGYALPAMQVFAAWFIAFISLIIMQATASSQKTPPIRSTTLVNLAGALAVGACVLVTGYFLVKNPTAVEYFPTYVAAIFAALLAACMWLTIFPPSGLTDSRTARWLGLAAAVTLGCGFVLSARLSIHTMGGSLIWTLFAPAAVCFVFSATAAAVDRQFSAGVQTAVWTAVLGTLLIYILSIPEAVHRFSIDGRTLGDGESGYPIGVNLLDSIWGLAQIPIVGFPFGVFGAAFGSSRRRSGGNNGHLSTQKNC